MSAPANEPRLSSIDGRDALLLYGAVQSVSVATGGAEPDGYWPRLLPDERPESALLLGLGGGTVAWLLQRRFGGQQPVRITGVEVDGRVIALARAQGWLDLPGLTVVQADAAAYLAACAARCERFDLVVVDLFGDDGVPAWVSARRFLARIAALLEPAGLLTLNLSRGQGHAAHLRRLRRRFAVERLIATGMNLVAHARPLPRRRHVMRPTRECRTSPRRA